LDGCCEHTQVAVDNEVLDYYTHLVRETDAFVYGRKTYELMVPYWPDIAKDHTGQSKADIEFAEAFCAVSQVVVFSKFLDRVEAKNTRIAGGNLRDEIVKLKQESGKPILVGGVDIPSQLTELGLIDEYRIVVSPVVAGQGRRLFDNVGLQERLRLKLIDSRTFQQSGCIALRYQTA
jgi:dihydrofolate reductase